MLCMVLKTHRVYVICGPTWVQWRLWQFHQNAIPTKTRILTVNRKYWGLQWCMPDGERCKIAELDLFKKWDFWPYKGSGSNYIHSSYGTLVWWGRSDVLHVCILAYMVTQTTMLVIHMYVAHVLVLSISAYVHSSPVLLCTVHYGTGTTMYR